MKAHKESGCFDANAWIGSWPFAMRSEETAATLVRRMRAAGVSRALVSPLRAVLAPDPMPANRELLESTRPHAALFPVPVIDPRLRIWREHLDASCADTRVCAIRIVPAWHAYTLRAGAVADLAAELSRRKLGLVLTARLEDERQQHPAISVRGLPVKTVAGFLQRLDPTPVLCTGLYRTEIMHLSPMKNMLADVAMAEWDQTVVRLLRDVSSNQLCFGSLSPFLSMPANVAKIADAAIPAASRRRIAAGNLDRFIRP